MDTVITAIAIMTGVGVFFGTMLAIAHRLLHVEEDPRLATVEAALPGSNCGACGEAGCHAFAEALVAGIRQPSGCTVAGEGVIASIAAFLGVDPGAQEKRVARLLCAGGIGAARQIAEYEGYGSCRAAHLVGGGGKGCAWGCLGLADCQAACDFDAIVMSDQKLPVVDVDKCTACGDCVDACPRDLFELMPVSHRLVVQCRAPLEGEMARSVCTVACDACGRCAQDAPEGLIRMENNLPVVDYAMGGPAGPEATFRCPTGAIRWVEREQFAEQGATPGVGDLRD